MRCAIYRSTKKADTYLYIEKQDDFSRLPDTLRQLLGELVFVMTLELELEPERRLAQADVEQVRAQLRLQGYYLQLPPKGGEAAGRARPSGA